jgi:hypothetical protein
MPTEVSACLSRTTINNNRPFERIAMAPGVLSINFIASALRSSAMTLLALVVSVQVLAQPIQAAPSKTVGLQSLVEPLWTDLTGQQRSVLEPFSAQWNTWSSQEKRVWVSLADKFPQYTPIQQAKAKQRIKDWAALTPEQRRLARSNYRMATQLPKGELADQKTRYEGMTHEQRVVLRENGSTSNTAAKYGGARTGLAKDAAKPLAGTQTAAAPTATPASGKGTAAGLVKP